MGIQINQTLYEKIGLDFARPQRKMEAASVPMISAPIFNIARFFIMKQP